MDALEQLEKSNFQALTSIAPMVSAARPVTQHGDSACSICNSDIVIWSKTFCWCHCQWGPAWA